MIKDSGERTKFESGAVRDMSEGKGRFDLMPLTEYALLFEDSDIVYIVGHMEMLLDEKIDSGSKAVIGRQIIKHFVGYMFEKECTKLTASEWAAISLSVAIHYEEGAKKYGENNWKKGIPLSSYVDSATRHLMKYLAGWEDERHDRAFIWNLLGYLWTIKNE